MAAIITKITFKYERQRRGLSTKEFAKLLGYSEYSIKDKEAGRRPITARDKKLIALLIENEA